MPLYLRLLFAVTAVLFPLVSTAANAPCVHIVNPGFEKTTAQFRPDGWNANYQGSDNPYCQRLAGTVGHYTAAGKGVLESGAINAIGIGYAEQNLHCMDTKKTYRLQLMIGHTLCQSDGNSKCFPPTLYISLDGVLLRATTACGPRSIPCSEGLNTVKYWTMQIPGIRPKTARPLLRFEWEYSTASSYYYHGLIDNVSIVEM